MVDYLNQPEIKRLIAALPDSWDAFKFGDYLKILDVNITEGNLLDPVSMQYVGVDNTLKTISVLLEIPYERLEVTPMPIIEAMARRLSFMVDLPVKPAKVPKNPFYKDLDTVTYNEYITLVELAKDPVHNMGKALQLFHRETLTDEALKNKSVSEVYTDFFILQKYVNKSLRRLTRSTARTLINQLATTRRPSLIKRNLRKI